MTAEPLKFTKIKSPLYALLLIAYSILIVKLIVFKLPSNIMYDIMFQKDTAELVRNTNLIPFDTIKRFVYAYQYHLLPTKSIVYNLVGNLVIFMPFGILLSKTFTHINRTITVFFITLAFTLSIEIFQYISYLGSFDIDDIILNVAGATIGYLIYSIHLKIISISA